MDDSGDHRWLVGPQFMLEGRALTNLSLCEAFARHLDETPGNPTARLHGTMWEDVSASAGTPAAEDDE